MSKVPFQSRQDPEWGPWWGRGPAFSCLSGLEWRAAGSPAGWQGPWRVCLSALKLADCSPFSP